ncbi:uncharacterized protein Ecym_1165 [Eremothecium cymbalariae DBVPG|uniref:Damage-regulated import facilitator 1 n=1 Tax=Eremothecium cymbalariae (strain CBS 270.75 / DBVPG 7215 / KCTC 17166 / NRRL Y-17582) TaxID=931890 RepID=G8JMV1_ERECY|nr:hypothetical protein Ecym_1165 [Eremothecium cymbalariae DBVPG\
MTTSRPSSGNTMAGYKRQLNSRTREGSEQCNEYQNELSTIGMRIRQAVDNGYQAPHDPVRGRDDAQDQFSNVCVQDNSRFTTPEYKRTSMEGGRQPPMLVNQRTMSSSSSLEAWETNLDERLSLIENAIMRNKLGAGDFMMSGTKRGFDQLEMDRW